MLERISGSNRVSVVSDGWVCPFKLEAAGFSHIVVVNKHTFQDNPVQNVFSQVNCLFF